MAEMLRFLTAGESHGPALTAILEGMVAGVPVSGGEIAPEVGEAVARAVLVARGVNVGNPSGFPPPPDRNRT